MNISYGPPAVHGVTTLMAVGAVEDDYATKADRALKVGAGLAAATLLGGLFVGSKTARNLGAGALIALLGVRRATRL